MQQEKICISCKKNATNLSGTASFNCPNCGKSKIIRCLHCRKTATKYTCSSCNFEGPN
ncbi:RNA-binding protein [Candidatus Woesearchaeota archaeon]|nr:RNA-binding protein [Candidatus Woesearchaeota archaeon]